MYSQTKDVARAGAVLGYFQRVCFGWEGWGVGGQSPPRGPQWGVQKKNHASPNFLTLDNMRKARTKKLFILP